MINSAILLNRGISFYLLIIVSGIITIINTIKKEKNVEKSDKIIYNEED